MLHGARPIAGESTAVAATRPKPARTKIAVAVARMPLRFAVNSRAAPLATESSWSAIPYPAAHSGGTSEMPMLVPAAVVAMSAPARRVA